MQPGHTWRCPTVSQDQLQEVGETARQAPVPPGQRRHPTAPHTGLKLSAVGCENTSVALWELGVGRRYLRGTVTLWGVGGRAEGSV